MDKPSFSTGDSDFHSRFLDDFSGVHENWWLFKLAIGKNLVRGGTPNETLIWIRGLLT